MAVVGTLDPHGNVSDLMVESLDVAVAYRTDPHIDQRERGAEAADLLHELWVGMTPHPVFVRVPIVAPNVALFTDDGPFAELIVVKVRSSFPVALDEFVDPQHMLFVDTPGRTSPMLHRMPFEHLPRPAHPLDDEFDWANPLTATGPSA